MNIFLTGGTGFLGKRLVPQLLAQGHNVRCLARPGSDTAALRVVAASLPGGGRLTFVPGNLDRPESFIPALECGDTFIHAAASMAGGTAVLFLNNVVATRRLLDRICGLRLRRFVLISSIGVYGTSRLRSGAVVDESCPLDPSPHLRDPYTYSKVVQDQIAWEAHKRTGLPLVVVRPGVIYGPGRGCLSSRVGLRFGGVMIKMGGGQQVPYAFVENCAAAIERAAAVEKIEGEAFNIVDDELPTANMVLRQHQTRVERMRVVPIPRWGISPLSRLCEWYHEKSRGQLPAVLTRYKSASQWGDLKYSNAKAKALLGWSPRVSVDEGLQRSCA
jgi:nucleoside-diphosphate-sugar epimerase